MAADTAGTVQVVDIGSVALEARVAMAVVVDIGSYVYLLQLNVCYYALRQNSGSYSTTDSEFLLRLPLSRRRLRRRLKLAWLPLLCLVMVKLLRLLWHPLRRRRLP